MAYEQKDNTGALFRNDKREKETHPHARGDAMIDGVRYEIGAWTKQDRNGNKFQSLSFKRKDERQEQPPQRQEPKQARYGDEDPF